MDGFRFRLPEKYKHDADRLAIVKGPPNPLLLRITFDDINTRSMAEAARNERVRNIRSSALLLWPIVLRRRFFERNSGPSRLDDDVFMFLRKQELPLNSIFG